MFKHILVPTDLTKKSQKALDIAVKLNGMVDSGRLTLIHVIEKIEGSDEAEFDSFYDKLETRARQTMGNMTAPYKGQSVPIENRILLGKRVPEIIRYAQEKDVDLIILSSHKIEKIDASDGWATISYRVGILSQCPVMMVKE